jgi:hypothetical protein
MRNQFNASQQPELFDESRQRWSQLPAKCRQTVKELLVKMMMSAIQEQSVIENQEGSHDAPSQDSAESFE